MSTSGGGNLSVVVVENDSNTDWDHGPSKVLQEEPVEVFWGVRSSRDGTSWTHYSGVPGTQPCLGSLPIRPVLLKDPHRKLMSSADFETVATLSPPL